MALTLNSSLNKVPIRIRTENAATNFLQEIVPLSIASIIAKRINYNKTKYFEKHNLPTVFYSLNSAKVRNNKSLERVKRDLNLLKTSIAKKYLQYIELAFTDLVTSAVYESYYFYLEYNEQSSGKSSASLDSLQLARELFEQIESLTSPYILKSQKVVPKISFTFTKAVPESEMNKFQMVRTGNPFKVIKTNLIAQISTGFHCFKISQYFNQSHENFLNETEAPAQTKSINYSSTDVIIKNFELEKTEELQNQTVTTFSDHASATEFTDNHLNNDDALMTSNSKDIELFNINTDNIHKENLNEETNICSTIDSKEEENKAIKRGRKLKGNKLKNIDEKITEKNVVTTKNHKNMDEEEQSESDVSLNKNEKSKDASLSNDLNNSLNLSDYDYTHLMRGSTSQEESDFAKYSGFGKLQKKKKLQTKDAINIILGNSKKGNKSHNLTEVTNGSNLHCVTEICIEEEHKNNIDVVTREDDSNYLTKLDGVLNDDKFSCKVSSTESHISIKKSKKIKVIENIVINISDAKQTKTINYSRPEDSSRTSKKRLQTSEEISEIVRFDSSPTKTNVNQEFIKYKTTVELPSKNSFAVSAESTDQTVLNNQENHKIDEFEDSDLVESAKEQNVETSPRENLIETEHSDKITAAVDVDPLNLQEKNTNVFSQSYSFSPMAGISQCIKNLESQPREFQEKNKINDENTEVFDVLIEPNSVQNPINTAISQKMINSEEKNEIIDKLGPLESKNTNPKLSENNLSEIAENNVNLFSESHSFSPVNELSQCIKTVESQSLLLEKNQTQFESTEVSESSSIQNSMNSAVSEKKITAEKTENIDKLNSLESKNANQELIKSDLMDILGKNEHMFSQKTEILEYELDEFIEKNQIQSETLIEEKTKSMEIIGTDKKKISKVDNMGSLEVQDKSKLSSPVNASSEISFIEILDRESDQFEKNETQSKISDNLPIKSSAQNPIKPYVFRKTTGEKRKCRQLSDSDLKKSPKAPKICAENSEKTLQLEETKQKPVELSGNNEVESSKPLKVKRTPENILDHSDERHLITTKQNSSTNSSVSPAISISQKPLEVSEIIDVESYKPIKMRRIPEKFVDGSHEQKIKTTKPKSPENSSVLPTISISQKPLEVAKINDVESNKPEKRKRTPKKIVDGSDEQKIKTTKPKSPESRPVLPTTSISQKPLEVAKIIDVESNKLEKRKRTPKKIVDGSDEQQIKTTKPKSPESRPVLPTTSISQKPLEVAKIIDVESNKPEKRKRTPKKIVDGSDEQQIKTTKPKSPENSSVLSTNSISQKPLEVSKIIAVEPYKPGKKKRTPEKKSDCSEEKQIKTTREQQIAEATKKAKILAMSKEFKRIELKERQINFNEKTSLTVDSEKQKDLPRKNKKITSNEKLSQLECNEKTLNSNSNQQKYLKSVQEDIINIDLEEICPRNLIKTNHQATKFVELNLSEDIIPKDERKIRNTKSNAKEFEVISNKSDELNNDKEKFAHGNVKEKSAELERSDKTITSNANQQKYFKFINESVPNLDSKDPCPKNLPKPIQQATKFVKLNLPEDIQKSSKVLTELEDQSKLADINVIKNSKESCQNKLPETNHQASKFVEHNLSEQLADKNVIEDLRESCQNNLQETNHASKFVELNLSEQLVDRNVIEDSKGSGQDNIPETNHHALKFVELILSEQLADKNVIEDSKESCQNNLQETNQASKFVELNLFEQLADINVIENSRESFQNNLPETTHHASKFVELILSEEAIEKVSNIPKNNLEIVPITNNINREPKASTEQRLKELPLKKRKFEELIENEMNQLAAKPTCEEDSASRQHKIVKTNEKMTNDNNNLDVANFENINKEIEGFNTGSYYSAVEIFDIRLAPLAVEFKESDVASSDFKFKVFKQPMSEEDRRIINAAEKDLDFTVEELLEDANTTNVRKANESSKKKDKKKKHKNFVNEYNNPDKIKAWLEEGSIHNEDENVTVIENINVNQLMGGKENSCELKNFNDSTLLQDSESIYKNTFMDIKLRPEMQKAKRTNIRKENSSSTSDSEDTKLIKCQCRIKKRIFCHEMVQCTICPNYEHSSCLGYRFKQQVPQPHVCYNCRKEVLTETDTDPLMKNAWNTKKNILFCLTRLYMYSLLFGRVENLMSAIPEHFKILLKENLKKLGFTLTESSDNYTALRKMNEFFNNWEDCSSS